MALAVNDDLRSDLQLAPGMRERTPAMVHRMTEAINKLRQLMKLYNVEERDYPVMEYRERLMKKYGDDEKLIFDLACEGPLSLRYDLTTQYALYDQRNTSKTFQVGKVYRRETSSQVNNRWREFYQFDVDFKTDDRAVDLCELFDMLVRGLHDLQLQGNYKILINSRRLLETIIVQECGVPVSQFSDVCVSLDKLDKIGWDGVLNEWSSKTIQCRDNDLNLIRQRIESYQADKQFVDLKNLIESYCGHEVTWSRTLVRGLAYYTDMIWEVVHVPSGLTICGGGEYDTNRCGISFGLDRMLDLISVPCNDDDVRTIIAVGDQGRELALLIAKDMRTQNIPMNIVTIDTHKKIRNAMGKLKKKYGPNSPCCILAEKEIKIYTENGTLEWK